MTTHTAQIWLTIASGGKWTTREVLAEFKEQRGKSVQQALVKMTQSGNLHQFADGSYGVKLESCPVRGVSLGEILRAVGAEK